MGSGLDIDDCCAVSSAAAAELAEMRALITSYKNALLLSEKNLGSLRAAGYVGDEDGIVVYLAPWHDHLREVLGFPPNAALTGAEGVRVEGTVMCKEE